MPMDHQPNTLSLSLDDSLYCNEEEEKWAITEDDFADSVAAVDLITNTNETDFISENEELLSLLSKEKEESHFAVSDSAIEMEAFLSDSRREAVEWIVKVNGYYGFSTLTAILAVNYLDRFIGSVHFQKDKAWVIHLASVTCLSLAAKVEETYVPLLLDFQVESKYVFEAKAIQKMELLMLSTLKWRMNVVTPLSFVGHIVGRLGLKNGGVLLRRCERLLLSVVVDSRMVRYEASVLATSSMVHVIHEIEGCNAIDYENKLIHLLKICKMKVKDCCGVISEIVSSKRKSSNKGGENEHYSCLKRKKNDVVPNPIPSSPNGVIDAFFGTTSDVSSNDSWAVSSSSSSPLKKKIRIQEQQMRLPSLPLNNRLFLEVVGSPH